MRFWTQNQTGVTGTDFSESQNLLQCNLQPNLNWSSCRRTKKFSVKKVTFRRFIRTSRSFAQTYCSKSDVEAAPWSGRTRSQFPNAEFPEKMIDEKTQLRQWSAVRKNPNSSLFLRTQELFCLSRTAQALTTFVRFQRSSLYVKREYSKITFLV